jgi:hypothetical protein
MTRMARMLIHADEDIFFCSYPRCSDIRVIRVIRGR